MNFCMFISSRINFCLNQMYSSGGVVGIVVVVAVVASAAQLMPYLYTEKSSLC